MSGTNHTRNLPGRLIAILCGLLMFAAASPALAATFDEIVAMQEAGLAPEIIIEVIEATGLDEPLDIDALIYLAENDVDSQVLDFLIDALPSDAAWVDLEDDSYTGYADISDHPNWAGGDGFYHGGTGYNPLRERDYDSRYSERSGSYYNNYYPNYTDDYRIRIYEPPVYMLDNNPYRAYRAPRYYNYRGNRQWNPYTGNRGHGYYRHDGTYYYHDSGWGGNLWGHHGYRNRWDNSVNFWWHDDNFSLRFSF